MSNSPELSVIVPCYNEEKLLEKSVEQVLLLRNSIENIEIIIVNDCSKDNSGVIAQQLAATHSSIKYFAHHWKDAVRAFWVILKYNTWHRPLV